MNTIKKAMMICVSCNNWDVPRHILIESENFTGERLNELVLRCFEMYKTKAGLQEEHKLDLADLEYEKDILKNQQKLDAQERKARTNSYEPFAATELLNKML